MLRYRVRMGVILSIMVLTALGLVAGAIYLWRRGGAGKQVSLMLVLAVVIAVNVAIWTLPDDAGESLIDRQPEETR